jgi:predicted nuclease with TOPRIM domain
MAKKPGFKKFRKLVSTDLDALRLEFSQMRTDLDLTRKQLDEMVAMNDELLTANNKVVADLRVLDDRLAHMGREFAN